MPNTCKSNGRLYGRSFGFGSKEVSGGWVSNAWITYLQVGDNSGKPELIPNKIPGTHVFGIKGGLSKEALARRWIRV